ncbi:MAG: CCA tRNA nucleotidyltransferase, partial [Hyphomonadaceae bacterium]
AKLHAGLDGISAERIWMESKKLCAAPQPIPALEAMQASGVMAQIFPEARGLDLLRKLVALETAQGSTPDALLRFLSLVWKDAAATRAIANRLKLSNDERNRIVWPAEDETPMPADMTPRDVRVALYRVGAPVVLDRAKLAWAESGDPAWADVIQLVQTWPLPVMPLSGADLVARGFAPGPAIGEALRKAETAWVASDFALTSEDLLRLV